MNPEQQHTGHTLPEGTILSDNYIIERVLGEGGFGITYSCTFRLTGEKAAVKEYFPSGLSHRVYSSDSKPSIVPYIGMEHEFEKGREHFLNEASILKEFQNLNSIVSVKDVIEANGTVYLVMEYIDGITLKQYVKENGALSFDEFLPLITPVIQALIQIHKRGLIHRDISPENLMIGLDNKLHLIDFGAANFENSHDTKTMTVILKNGFAPPEQYLSDGKQGAWTDIYALCSTMYMMLTGFAPPESIKRIQKDELPSLAAHANITSWQAAAIEKGMSLNAADRFQNMESLYQALIIPPLEIASKRRGYQNLSIEENKTVMKPDTNTNRKQSFFHKNAVPFLLTGLFLLLCTYSFLGISGKNVPYWPETWTYETPLAATIKPQAIVGIYLYDICDQSIDTFETTAKTIKEEQKKKEEPDSPESDSSKAPAKTNNYTPPKSTEEEYNFTTLEDEEDEYNFSTLEDE
ncbi:MAG: serine/threonine-protein kinase [Clostridiales bacterium]|nr:serine/threonine-protein kinase [Clostridiales bacterium]